MFWSLSVTLSKQIDWMEYHSCALSMHLKSIPQYHNYCLFFHCINDQVWIVQIAKRLLYSSHGNVFSFNRNNKWSIFIDVLLKVICSFSQRWWAIVCKMTAQFNIIFKQFLVLAEYNRNCNLSVFNYNRLIIKWSTRYFVNRNCRYGCFSFPHFLQDLLAHYAFE